MDIRAERLDDAVTVLALSGELDASNFEELIDAARRAAETGARRLVIDLSDLSYMGSSGLVALHSAAMVMRGEEPPSPESGWAALHHAADEVAAAPTDEPVSLVAPQPAVRRVLERSGMAGIFPIHPDRATAAAAVGGLGS